jgi:hypothetical protein
MAEAHELAFKARNIKIPKPNPQDWCVRYVTDHHGLFAQFEIIEANWPQRYDHHNMFRGDHLDLAIPRRLKPYDKKGSRLFLTNFKYYFFGSNTARLTRQKCEDFFANPDNFVPVSARPAFDQTDLIDAEEERWAQDWGKENERIGAQLAAKERSRIEKEAAYCPVAAERLATIVDEEDRQRALVECAEDERRRQAMIEEAAQSSLADFF